MDEKQTNQLLEKFKKRHHRFYKVGSTVISVIAGLLALLLIFYSSYVLFDTFYINHMAMSSTDLMQYKPKITQTVEINDNPVPLTDNPETTRGILGEDYVAWITMPKTHIDYPVMQGDNDLEYAYKNIYGKNSISGSIYLATDNNHDMSDNYNIFYGHHMDNGAMFGDLNKFTDETFFNEYAGGYLIVDNVIYDLNVVAVMYTNAYEGMIYYVTNQSSSRIQSQKQFILDGSLYADQTALNDAEKLLILSTCAGATTDGRLIVVTSMTVRTEPLPVEEIDDPPAPKHQYPTIYEDAGAWALLNLILLVCTVYLVFPLCRLRSKFRRRRIIAEINEYYDDISKVDEATLKHRQRVALIVEIIFALLSIILFLLTENLKLPITLVDKWTIWMLILYLAVWIVDVCMYRWKQRKNEFEMLNIETFRQKLKRME